MRILLLATVFVHHLKAIENLYNIYLWTQTRSSFFPLSANKQNHYAGSALGCAQTKTLSGIDVAKQLQ